MPWQESQESEKAQQPEQSQLPSAHSSSTHERICTCQPASGAPLKNLTIAAIRTRRTQPDYGSYWKILISGFRDQWSFSGFRTTAKNENRLQNAGQNSSNFADHLSDHLAAQSGDGLRRSEIPNWLELLKTHRSHSFQISLPKPGVACSNQAGVTAVVLFDVKCFGQGPVQAQVVLGRA
jgi:hypothetical protein